MRAFIALRKLSKQHQALHQRLEELRTELYTRLDEQDIQLSSIYEAIENLLDEKVQSKSWDEREQIGFKK